MSLTIINEKILQTYEKEQKLNSYYNQRAMNYKYGKELKEDYNEDIKNYGKAIIFSM